MRQRGLLRGRTFASSPFPMPSSTENARTTNVKVAGKRKGWSLDTLSRSSPMEDRIALRLCLLSSFVRCGLNSALYASSPIDSRAAFWSASRWPHPPNRPSPSKRAAVEAAVAVAEAAAAEGEAAVAA